MKKSKNGFIFTILGLICISLALLLSIYNIYEDYHAGQSSNEVIDELTQEIINNKENKETTDHPDKEMPTKYINNHYYIGVLEVPSINLSLPVMEDWSYQQLKIVPCRYTGSVYKDNMVIAGHNYTNHFMKIARLSAGSEIRFVDVEGNVYYYKIVNIEKLKPTDVEYLTQESDDWDLTLFTCTLGGGKRIAIRCARVNK